MKSPFEKRLEKALKQIKKASKFCDEARLDQLVSAGIILNDMLNSKVVKE